MIEIERKFLVIPNRWPVGKRQIKITQGYLMRSDGSVLRVRQKDGVCFLSIKARIDEVSSFDFEYVIPVEDAGVKFEHMCRHGIVRKTRHVVKQGELAWEIDEFHDENHGLVVAEIELPAHDYPFEKPDWLSQEVTTDTRYHNASLAQAPYKH